MIEKLADAVAGVLIGQPFSTQYLYHAHYVAAIRGSAIPRCGAHLRGGRLGLYLDGKIGAALNAVRASAPDGHRESVAEPTV